MSIYSIGLSGLQASSEDLNAISQNISNSSTSGYKSISTEYASSYSGSTASGVSVSNTSTSFGDDGDMVSTGSNLDVAISGNGFFVLDIGDGSYAYTRAGSFSTDSNYNIVSSSGLSVAGYGVDADGNILNGVLTDLAITETTVPASASTEVAFTANLNADATTVATTSTFDAEDGTTYNYSVTTSVYDSLGTSHEFTQYYVKTDDNTWDVHYSLDGTENAQVDTITFDSDGELATVNDSAAYTADTSGNKVYDSAVSTLSLSGIDITGANSLTLSIPLVASRNSSSATVSPVIEQYATDFSSTSSADGYTAGSISDVYFDSDGYLWASYDNGQTLLQGQLVLASFSNTNGLEASGGTMWYATSESGNPTYGTAGTGSLGTLTVGSYENSNVDVSSELVDLMTAQQVYQANAKVLTAADDLASVLFNTF
jgi:flagellar hook protein FlgE